MNISDFFGLLIYDFQGVFMVRFHLAPAPPKKKRGPAGQRCVHGHIKHMKHMYEAHV